MTQYRETSDDYSRVIAQCGPIRAAVCKDGLQWLLQRRSGNRWRSEAYCRTREALVRHWQNATGDDGAALGIVATHFLPKGAWLEAEVGIPNGSSRHF
jgi:hypothetical protein